MRSSTRPQEGLATFILDALLLPPLSILCGYGISLAVLWSIAARVAPPGVVGFAEWVTARSFLIVFYPLMMSIVALVIYAVASTVNRFSGIEERPLRLALTATEIVALVVFCSALSFTTVSGVSVPPSSISGLLTPVAVSVARSVFSVVSVLVMVFVTAAVLLVKWFKPEMRQAAMSIHLLALAALFVAVLSFQFQQFPEEVGGILAARAAALCFERYQNDTKLFLGCMKAVYPLLVESYGRPTNATASPELVPEAAWGVVASIADFSRRICTMNAMFVLQFSILYSVMLVVDIHYERRPFAFADMFGGILQLLPRKRSQGRT